MTKTLVACSPAPDARYFRDLFPHDRDRAARTRRRRERMEVSRMAAAGIQEMRDEQSQRAAEDSLAELVEYYSAVEITWRNLDWGQYEITQAAKAAGLDREARHRIKDTLFGSPCHTCGFRGCKGECRELDDRWEYDWDRDTR
jgi:hypothetical protein